MNARNDSFKTETILKAWEKCGIRPINPGIFTKQDYAPSFETSTTTHVPPLYPMEQSPDEHEDSADESEYLPSETETETNDEDAERNGGEEEATWENCPIGGQVLNHDERSSCGRSPDMMESHALSADARVPSGMLHTFHVKAPVMPDTGLSSQDSATLSKSAGKQ